MAFGFGYGNVYSSVAALLVGSGPPPPVTYDYTVTNDAEFAAVLANSAAVLSGKTIGVSGSNFTQISINNLDIAAQGAPLTIRSVNATSSVPALLLTNTVTGIDFTGLNHQMTGWPFDYAALVQFGTGSFDKLTWSGCSFRHGYGPSQVDIDPLANYPEYVRVDNIQTATTTSQTFALSWQDAAATDAWIEFFNNGANDVRVEIGAPGVVATAGSILAPVGAITRINGLDPTIDTHFAVMSVAGTSPINARSEIGLYKYLAPAFKASGSSVMGDLVFKSLNFFRDLQNGIKGVGNPDTLIVIDNLFRRIYMDIIAVGAVPETGRYRIFRNLMEVPIARSGRKQDQLGDAGDPHGDGIAQTLVSGVGAGVVRDIRIGGNLNIAAPRRISVLSQSIFLSDNDNDESYADMIIAANAGLGGANNAFASGEAGFPLGDALIFGNTFIDGDDPLLGSSAIRASTDGNHDVYVGFNLVQNFVVDDQPYRLDNNLKLSDAADPAAVLPNIAGLSTADTRAEIETALTTAAEGIGKGAVANKDCIDWVTSDPEAMFIWANIPSGASWEAMEGLEPSTLTELPLRKILNRGAAQAVAPSAGCEWRAVDTDGVTETQAWTSGAGTIEPDQYIQARTTTSALGITETSVVLSINGWDQIISLTTKAAAPSVFLINNAAGRFVAPVNVPSGTSRLTFRGKFKFASIANNMKMFTQASTGCDLIITSSDVKITVEDSSGAKLATNAVAPGLTFATGVWYDVTFDVDQASNTATLTVDGTGYVVPLASGTGTFQSNRKVSFLATTSGGNALPAGTEFADLSVDYNGALHKSISNTAATANADPWKLGGDFTQG